VAHKQQGCTPANGAEHQEEPEAHHGHVAEEEACLQAWQRTWGTQWCCHVSFSRQQRGSWELVYQQPVTCFPAGSAVTAHPPA
jgi:hypothetical protein